MIRRGFLQSALAHVSRQPSTAAAYLHCLATMPGEKRGLIVAFLIFMACLCTLQVASEPAWAARGEGSEGSEIRETIKSGAGGAVLTEAEVKALIAAAPGEEDFPNAEAVVLFRGDDIRLYPDGRISRRSHSLVLLPTELAIDAMGDPRVSYDLDTQELVIHRCRTHTTGGQVVDAGDHAFNRVTPSAVARCTDELHRQEMVITHVGIERGCVIELDVEIIDTVAHSPWLEGVLFFQERYPVVHRAVSISTPSHLRLSREVVNGEQETSVTERSGATTHHWQAVNIPPAWEQDDGAGGRLGRTHLLYSTCPSWDFLVMRLREGIEAAAQADSAMRRWAAEELLQGEPLTRTERVEVILNLTSDLIRGASVQPLAAYRPPRPAARTFQIGCGNDWDRAVLALALLRDTGIGGYGVLCAASSSPTSDVPALIQFDRVLLRTPASTDSLLLDPLAGQILRGPQARDHRILMTIGASGPQWELTDKTDGIADIEVSARLEPDGSLEGSAEIHLSGALLPYQNGRDLDAFLTSYAGRLAEGAEIGSSELLIYGPETCRLRFTFHTDAVGETDGGRRYVRLEGGPVSIPGLCDRFGLSSLQRDTPVFLGAPLREQVTWRILIPEGIHTVFLPPTAEVCHWAGEFRLSTERMPRLSHRASGNDSAGNDSAGEEGAGTLLTISWTLSLPEAVIPPLHYGELQRILRAYKAENQRLIILSES